ncbi:MAG: GLPGLI family protein [Saprospiraceae bacterium]|nr:GLPGLI family protein [Saprospiraceae bacterium]
MKNKILFLIFCLPFILKSQQSSGEIKYEERIKIIIDLPEGNESLKKTLPPSQTILKTLLFTSNESYYRDDAKNEDLDITHEENGMDMQIVMKNPENNIYTNQEKNLLIQSTEFFGKQFLVTGDLSTKKWKLTDDQKMILGYPCQKAILMDTTLDVVAWFTPQIPIHIGPNGFTNLPGVILRIEFDKDSRTITATQLNFRNLKENEIIKPTKGKKLTAQEFKIIRDEKMKEMGMIQGKGGAVKMIIKEDRN